MRRRGFLIALALAAIPSFAGAVDPGPSLQPGQTLRGVYLQERRLKGFSAPLRSEGRFALALGAGLIWRAEKPFAVTTVITAAGLAQEVGGTEVMRLPASRMPFLNRLYDLLGGALGGNWRLLETDFSVQRSEQNGRWKVVLTPRKQGEFGMPFQSIMIDGGQFVDQVELLKPDGDVDRLTFHDQALSQAPLTAEESALLGSISQ